MCIRDRFQTTCKVFRPTRAEFAHGLLAFVEKVTAEDPNVPLFKVIPPAGWRPTSRRPNLDRLVINTPIKQMVRARCLGALAAAPGPDRASRAGVRQAGQLPLPAGGAEGARRFGAV